MSGCSPLQTSSVSERWLIRVQRRLGLCRPSEYLKIADVDNLTTGNGYHYFAFNRFN